MFTESKKEQKQIKRQYITSAYHVGCGIGLLGLLFLLIGISLHGVFELFIFDQRQTPTFYQVNVKLGLFGNTGLLVDQMGNVNRLQKPLELSDSRWYVAKLMAIFGILAVVFATPIHITSSFFINWRKWWIILLELSLLFISVICILICLSLAESEIELIHDSDDYDLKAMLHKNGLMILKEKTKATVDNTFVGNWGRRKIDVNAQEYSLVLSPPRHSYYLFIASEFCELFSFLCTLVFFIKTSDQDEKRKTLLKMERFEKRQYNA